MSFKQEYQGSLFQDPSTSNDFDIQIYTCDLCSASFTDEHTLAEHLNMHICEERFSIKTELESMTDDKCTTTKQKKVCELKNESSFYSLFPKLINAWDCEINTEIKEEDVDKNNNSMQMAHTNTTTQQKKGCEIKNTSSVLSLCPKLINEFDCEIKTETKQEVDEEKDNPVIMSQTNQTNMQYSVHSSQQTKAIKGKSSERYAIINIISGEEPFKCDICGAQFITKSCLRVHYRFHSGVRPLKCDICGEKCILNCDLKTHKSKHSGEEPFVKLFKCDICGTQFTQKGNLQKHTKIHTGKKPFKCDICGAQFTYKGNLKAHTKVHTRIHTDKKPFKCDLCGAQFTYKNSFIGHTKVHTRDSH